MKKNYKKKRQPPRNTPQTAKDRVYERRRKQAKRRRIKFLIGRISFLFIFIIGVIYLIGIVIEATQKPVISYQTVQMGIIDNSDVFEGLVVRNETVVGNTKEGNMNLIAAEGDRVRKGGSIYQILDSSQSLELEQSLQSVEADIERVQEKRQDISYFQNEIQEINNNIKDYIEIYHMQSKTGTLEDAHELKRQIEYEIAKRKNVHMKDSAGSLNSLQNQKEGLSSKLNSNAQVYRADQPGIISYHTDGYEDKFTLDNIGTIKEDDINKKYPNISTISGDIIKENDPAYRIVKDNTWKMVSFIPKFWADKFQVGQEHNFILLEDKGSEFSLYVEENIEVNEDLYKIIFSSKDQLDLFLNKRSVSFKSLEYKYNGLKIPTSAISERNLIKIPTEYIINSDEGTGVMRLSDDSSTSAFVNLSIQYEDDGYTHVLQDLEENQELRLKDTIVEPSKNDKYQLSEVSTTKGVYVVNGRITKFKPIEILTENEEYCIVKSTSTNGLKQFDQIVTNPKNIREEQLLRNMDVKNAKQ